MIGTVGNKLISPNCFISRVLGFLFLGHVILGCNKTQLEARQMICATAPPKLWWYIWVHPAAITSPGITGVSFLLSIFESPSWRLSSYFPIHRKHDKNIWSVILTLLKKGYMQHKWDLNSRSRLDHSPKSSTTFYCLFGRLRNPKHKNKFSI